MCVSGVVQLKADLAALQGQAQPKGLPASPYTSSNDNRTGQANVLAAAAFTSALYASTQAAAQASKAEAKPAAAAAANTEELQKRLAAAETAAAAARAEVAKLRARETGDRELQEVQGRMDDSARQLQAALRENKSLRVRFARLLEITCIVLPTIVLCAFTMNCP